MIAQNPVPGSADIWFISKTDLAEIIEHMRSMGVTIEKGPVQRTGAMGPIISVYIRDPDGNLLEISTYLNEKNKATA